MTTYASLSLNHGATGFTITDITVDTQQPNAGDVELRFALTDQASPPNNITREDLILALKAFERVFTSGAVFTNSPIL